MQLLQGEAADADGGGAAEGGAQAVALPRRQGAVGAGWGGGCTGRSASRVRPRPHPPASGHPGLTPPTPPPTPVHHGGPARIVPMTVSLFPKQTRIIVSSVKLPRSNLPPVNCEL